ncbi:MAG: pyrroline-5-carboxylate reductase [Microbacteriaceae bacterium]|nr:pyrroline-5-carboxylate reductase [Microbacteriaceae bacterium]
MLGVGSMGGAILAGLRAQQELLAEPVSVTTYSAESTAAYRDVDDVIARATVSEPDANRLAVRGAKVVILAVKPWAILDLLDEIAHELEPDAIVVSVAAGVTAASMEATLPRGIAVVRAMPNTPSHVGLGMTGIAPGRSASAADVETVARVFATVGEVLVVREDQINAVTAVSGSGPAYLFFFVEQLAAAAERAGFDAQQATKLAEQTVIGAAELMRRSDQTPAELRRGVTSPKGTTEQAILVLQDAGLDDALDRAFAANIHRSEELEEENSAG